MIEVELKYALTPELLKKVREKLQHMQYEKTVTNVDIYYDTPHYELIKQAVFVRVRNNQVLEFKFNEQAEVAHVRSTEKAFPLVPNVEQAQVMNGLFTHFLPNWSSVPSFEEARVRNNLIVLAPIHNRREVYTDGMIQMHLDHVENLGDFLEIEMECAEGTDTNQALSQVKAFAADLDGQHIKVGYVELWLKQHNPEAYHCEKYHLE